MSSTDLCGHLRSLFVTLHRTLSNIFPNLSKSGGNVTEGHEANAERAGEVRRIHFETDERDEQIAIIIHRARSK